MPNNPRSQSLQHLELLVIVPLVHLLFGVASGMEGLSVVQGVVVYRDSHNVVQATNEVIDVGVCRERLNERSVCRTYPLALEADQNV